MAIGARGGSKGVRHKNRRIVAGLPLISYTLRAAKDASALDRIVVTTDEEEIAAIARGEGVEVVMRPAAIAGDESPVIDAVRHALDALGGRAGVIALLQPTSPFRSAADIDAAIALYREKRAPVCSVYPCEDNHPARMYRIEDGRMVSLFPISRHSAARPAASITGNGCLYVLGRRGGSGRIIGVRGCLMEPPSSSVNIDTELDLLLMAAVLDQARENPAARA